MGVLDDICAYADRKLKGSTVTFALVAWVKGDQANPQSLALSAPPDFTPQVKEALTTMVDVLDPRRKELNRLGYDIIEQAIEACAGGCGGPHAELIAAVDAYQLATGATAEAAA